MLVDTVVAMDEGRVVTMCEPAELAERLGLRAWMHLVLRNGHRATAVDILSRSGFEAKQNSTGVLVEVSELGKGAALTALHRAGITVDDLEVWR